MTSPGRRSPRKRGSPERRRGAAEYAYTPGAGAGPRDRAEDGGHPGAAGGSPLEKYKVLRQIGKGQFSTAHLIVDRRTKRKYVLKKIRLARQTPKQRESSLRELNILSQVDHANIVWFKEGWVEKGCIVYIVLEHCPGGDLHVMLRNVVKAKHASYIPEDIALDMFCQQLLALQYVHGMDIVHRDIKGSNIFLRNSTKGDGIVQLGDFGLARLLGEGERTNSFVGTPAYMAPEVLNGEEYDRASDVWSLGCVFYEMLCLKPPFTAFNVQGLAKKVLKTKPAPIPEHFSAEVRELVGRMLKKKPTLRPTANEMLELPLFQPYLPHMEDRIKDVLEERDENELLYGDPDDGTGEGAGASPAKAGGAGVPEDKEAIMKGRVVKKKKKGRKGKSKSPTKKASAASSPTKAKAKAKAKGSPTKKAATKKAPWPKEYAEAPGVSPSDVYNPQGSPRKKKRASPRRKDFRAAPAPGRPAVGGRSPRKEATQTSPKSRSLPHDSPGRNGRHQPRYIPHPAF